MIRYKTTGLEKQFNTRLHLETRAVAVAFSKWSEEMGLPAPIVTDIGRTPDFYAKNKLKFVDSWHLYFTAIDFRVEHYTPSQHAQVVKWFTDQFKQPEWELIVKEHGTGPHIHLARRDPTWRVSSQPVPVLNGEGHNG